MTHDELLAKIDEDSIYFDYPDPHRNALRAVVELHRPVEYPIGISTDPEYKSPVEILCSCSRAFNDYDKVYYPCPTVQAIEKELS